MMGRHLYTLYWQLRKSLRCMHFNLLFFLLSQLVWPMILVGTFYLSYTPLLDPSASEAGVFTGGAGLFSYLIPGIIVIFLYLEYISLGMSLALDRDYGVLEPILLSPVNRLLWLFGNAFSVIPSGLLSAAGFLISSYLVFGIRVPHPAALAGFILIIVITSIPWGAMICAVFLCGRNSRFLYTIFETPAEFLSGSRFPVAALPALLSGAALFYPLSHAVSFLRLCWYQEIPLSLVFKELLWMTVLSLLYAVIAVLIFTYAEQRGKRDGTLTFT